MRRRWLTWMRVDPVVGIAVVALVAVVLVAHQSATPAGTIPDPPGWLRTATASTPSTAWPVQRLAARAKTTPTAATSTTATSTAATSTAATSTAATSTAATAVEAGPTTSTSLTPRPSPTNVPAKPLPPTISRVATTDKVVFLTIDDGYVRDPAVADQIKRAHVPVSLFLVGSAARAATPYFADLVASGATVEDHTLTHPQLKGMSSAAQTSEICGAATLDRQLFNAAPSLFRPPYGVYDTNTRQAAARCGFPTMILWQATVNDGVLKIQGRDHLLPGDIILMHFRTDLAVNFALVLAKVAADGLTVGRLEDYL